MVPDVEPAILPPRQTTRCIIFYILRPPTLVELEPTASNQTRISTVWLGFEMEKIRKEIPLRWNAKEGLTEMNKDAEMKNGIGDDDGSESRKMKANYKEIQK